MGTNFPPGAWDHFPQSELVRLSDEIYSRIKGLTGEPRIRHLLRKYNAARRIHTDIFTRIIPFIKRYCRKHIARHTVDSHIYDDVLQEMLLTAYRHVRIFDPNLSDPRLSRLLSFICLKLRSAGLKAHATEKRELFHIRMGGLGDPDESKTYNALEGQTAVAAESVVGDVESGMDLVYLRSVVDKILDSRTLTIQQQQIANALFGPQARSNPLSVAQVAELLGIHKSRVQTVLTYFTQRVVEQAGKDSAFGEYLLVSNYLQGDL
jgi:DNA-directed RNA polymerase specialized sigma24 family protein/predicted XRE-type DNA-binding protein